MSKVIMTMPYSIDELNQMNREAFVRALGAVFEDTPAIAQQAWNDRPFRDVTDLHQKMVAFINAMTPHEQLALIQSHPDLGSRAKMAVVSVQEQAGAGLDQLSPEEYEQFQFLNQAYKVKFGFPFIIAVKHHTKASILKVFKQRLQNNDDSERQQALTEITQIARFRLQDLVS